MTANIKGLASSVKGSVLYQIKKQNLDFKGKSIINIRERHHIMIKFNSLGRSAILNFWAFVRQTQNILETAGKIGEYIII